MQKHNLKEKMFTLTFYYILIYTGKHIETCTKYTKRKQYNHLLEKYMCKT